MACVPKASDADWVALAEAVAAGIDTDGVEAARRAVFPERVASARIDAWFAPPKRKKKRFPREISDAARAAQMVVAALAATDEAEAFARSTAADLRAARRRAAHDRLNATPGACRGQQPRRAGGGARGRGRWRRDCAVPAVTDRQLFQGRAGRCAGRRASRPRRPPPRPEEEEAAPPGCDCAATGPHRRTCPLYRRRPRSPRRRRRAAPRPGSSRGDIRGLQVEEAAAARVPRPSPSARRR